MPKMNTFFNRPETADVKKPQSIHKNIDYTNLLENPHQYRTFTEEDVAALADLILADGKILQPVLVRKHGADTFEIIAGHKRCAAIKHIVEKLDMPEFRLIPCNVEDLTDAQAEFAVYSTNGYGKKSPHEIMCEVEGMIRLIKEHPEDFNIPKGTRTIEAIAESLGLSRTVASEYHALAKNLSEEGKTALKEEAISKSAAIALSQKPIEEQKAILEESATLTTSSIKQELPPPDDDDIMNAFDFLENRYTMDDAGFKEQIVELCRQHTGTMRDGYEIEFRLPGHIAINNKCAITASALVKRITECVPFSMRLKAHNKNKEAIEELTISSIGMNPPETQDPPNPLSEQLEEAVTDLETARLKAIAFNAVTNFLQPVTRSYSNVTWRSEELIDMANVFFEKLQKDDNLIDMLSGASE